MGLQIIEYLNYRVLLTHTILILTYLHFGTIYWVIPLFLTTEKNEPADCFSLNLVSLNWKYWFFYHAHLWRSASWLWHVSISPLVMKNSLSLPTGDSAHVKYNIFKRIISLMIPCSFMSKTEATVSHFLPQNLFMYFALRVILGWTTTTTRSNSSRVVYFFIEIEFLLSWLVLE